jgi:hypothetical protein
MKATSDILVLRNRRTGGYSIKYMRFDKRGGELHRTIDCRSLEEAQAEAIDVNRRLFDGKARIVGIPATR